MSADYPHIAVIGAGAIGGITAAFLAQAGYEVELVCKHQSIADISSGQGLHIRGVRGERQVTVSAVPEVSQLSGSKDIVFLATKATDMLDPAREVQALLSKDGYVVSLQNGVCEPALAEVLGRERVMGCVVGFGATMLGPGEMEMTSEGEFVVGELDGGTTKRLEELAGIMQNVIATRPSANIMGELYGKLIINSCINSLGALTGMYLGEMLAIKRVRERFLTIMTEAMAVAAAMDIKVAPGAEGKLDYYKFLGSGNGLARLKQHLFIRVIGFKYRRLKSSTLQSLERGKPTEIGYLNGYIADMGRKHDTPTPVNSAIVNLVREIEAGERRMGIGNLDQIPA